MRYINLQFFKGGSSVKEVDKREPKSDQLKAMDDAMYNVMGGLAQRYGGVTMPSITSYTPTTSGTSPVLSNSSNTGAGNWMSDNEAYSSMGDSQARNYIRKRNAALANNKNTSTSTSNANAVTSNGKFGVTGNSNVANAAAGYDNSGWGANGYLTNAYDTADYLANKANQNSAELLNTVPGYLTKSDSTLDQAQKYAVQAGQQANNYYNDADWYLNNHQDLLTNGTNQGLQNLLDNLNSSTLQSLKTNAGNALDDWASKGIVNGTTATRAMDNLTGNAATAMANNYLNAYNTMANNYISGADASKGLAESRVNTADNSTSNLVNIANGYTNNYNSGLSGLKTYADLPSTYYTNAMAPLTPAYNYWNQATQNWLANDKDYVATSSGK